MAAAGFLARPRRALNRTTLVEALPDAACMIALIPRGVQFLALAMGYIDLPRYLAE